MLSRLLGKNKQTKAGSAEAKAKRIADREVVKANQAARKPSIEERKEEEPSCCSCFSTLFASTPKQDQTDGSLKMSDWYGISTGYSRF